MIYGFGLAALCIAWLIPGHYFPWTGFQQETAAGIGALLLAVAVLASTGQRPVPFPRLAALSLALAAIPLLQWSTGHVPYLADAALSSLYLVAFALTVVAAATLALAGPHAFAASVMAMLFLGALACNAIGFAQWLQVAFEVPMEHLDPGGRVYANFTQPNHLASVLGLGIVACIWLFEKRHIGRGGVALAVGFFAFGIVLTQSRAGWAFALLIATWWAIARRMMPMRTTASGVVVSIGIFAAMTAALAPINAALGMGTATLLAERVTTVGARGINWAVLWDAVWQRPLFGWGWMRVGEAQQSTTLSHPPSHEWVSFSHNILLDLLVWNGVIVGVLVCLAVALWVFRRCVSSRDVDTWAMLAAGGVLTTHALLEFPHGYAYFLLPMAIFVGVIEARAGSANLTARSMPRWVFATSTASMAGLLAWVCIEYLEVEEAGRRQRFKEAGYVVAGEHPFVPDVVLLDNQREFLWFRMTEATEGMSERDIERMRQVQQRFMPPAVLLRYAIATGLNHRPAEAARSLRLVCHMWPKKNCDEGRENWAKLQARYPQLRSIAFPVLAPDDRSEQKHTPAPPFGDGAFRG